MLYAGIDPKQLDDAEKFVTAVHNQLKERGDKYDKDQITHVAHSLGGYLAIRMADEEGQHSRAIAFDNPKTSLHHMQAHIVSVLNEDNIVNTASTGTHLGTVLRLDNHEYFELNIGAPHQILIPKKYIGKMAANVLASDLIH